MSRKPRRRRSAPTPAQIWRILHATAREARIARRELAAERRRIAQQEARREAQRQQEAVELDRRFREAEQKRERERAEWEKEEAQRDRKLERELYKILGDGDNRWGRLIEALVQGNIKTIFRNAGIEVEHALARRRSRIRGIWREYDLVAVGDADAVVVEVKATLRPGDVAKFSERIANFREWRWDDARPRVWGALAYLTTQEDAVRDAEEAGFYLIQAVSGSAKLVNSPGFEPRVF